MLKQGGGGAILSTSSGAGLAGIRWMPAYVAAKHGVAGLTRAAALEYGRHNLRINAMCPGPIRTQMMARGLKRRPDLEERYTCSEPLKRLGEPEEIGVDPPRERSRVIARRQFAQIQKRSSTIQEGPFEYHPECFTG
jgi:NAD(P)-dependent dehydrogenase (short-subunit alcohol dehydrogenase family)